MLHNAYMDIGFYIMFFPIVFFYGICIGSFLNVVIIRLPRGDAMGENVEPFIVPLDGQDDSANDAIDKPTVNRKKDESEP